MCSKMTMSVALVAVSFAGVSLAGPVADRGIPDPLTAIAPLTPAAGPAVFKGDPLALLVKTQATNEDKSWNLLGDNPTSLGLLMFLEKYPSGAHELDAKRQLAIALQNEVSAADAAEQKENTAAVTETDEAETAAVEDDVAQEDTDEVVPVAASAVVKFDVPLFHGASHIKGKTIKELITGSPLFPPVADLPEEYWKEETCKSCHTWTKVNLCEQAAFYLREDGKASLAKQHPYGGTFKENLQSWATDDCQ